MTKEKMIEQVEIASKMHDILKDVPVNERHLIHNVMEQFNRADWDKLHSNQTAAYGLVAGKDSPCANPN